MSKTFYIDIDIDIRKKLHKLSLVKVLLNMTKAQSKKAKNQ